MTTTKTATRAKWEVTPLLIPSASGWKATARGWYPTVKGAVRCLSFHPLDVQVFPTFAFESWDYDRLLPCATPYWTVRVFLLEVDPANPEKPKPDEPDAACLTRVLLHISDRVRSQASAKNEAIKTAKGLTALLPTILRTRKAGKALKLVPAKMGSGRTVAF